MKDGWKKFQPSFFEIKNIPRISYYINKNRYVESILS
jgi:hypothetical protein